MPTHSFVLFLSEVKRNQLQEVGGKALNLGRLVQAGFPVPPGFVITTEGVGRLGEGEMRAAIAAAYRELGAGRVAVRSSATAEDLEDASFAGQQETSLDIVGEEALLEAVRRCRDSLLSDRAAAYRRAQGIPDDAVRMAVVVQRMVPAEVAGVLFTRDPTDSTADRMLVEAVRGLGEALVSGRMMPDRWTLDAASGQVLSTRVGGEPCLNRSQLARLAELGRRVEAELGAPQDLEWALAGGELFLLQSRPLTSSAGQREAAREAEIARLRARAEPGGTVWSRYSLAEVLPEPLPYTWALWRRFMSGGGGYGRMYRELGFDPDPCLDEDGVLDLIAGRLYFNLSRDARLYFRHFPNDYPFGKLKAEPSLAIYPRPEPNLAKASRDFPLRFIGVMRQMLAAERTLERAAEEVPAHLEECVFPQIAAFAASRRSADLTGYSDQELLEAVREVETEIFDRFLPQALKPGVLAGLALQKLETARRPAHAADARKLAEGALAGAALPPEHDLAAGLRSLAAGEWTAELFLERFGHRGPGEMELACPRWNELGSESVECRTANEVGAMTKVEAAALPKVIRHSKFATRHSDRARRFAALREQSKHFLMLPYEVLRRLLLELDRRYDLDGGIFYLEPGELSQLISGAPLGGRVAERRKRRALLLGLEAPRVLFSDDLEAIGRRMDVPQEADVMRGTGISPGVAEGEALVVRSPEDAPPHARDFILVCPSTDPGWTPLFLRARGLVLETGGVLSHGAIVAREFGLPAVANVPNACALYGSGQRLRVDGGSGEVWPEP